MVLIVKFYGRYPTEESLIKNSIKRIRDFSNTIDEIIEIKSSTRIKASDTRKRFNE